MPKPIVTQTRLDPSAVVTMSFALDVQVGRDPGAPGAISAGMTLFYLKSPAKGSGFKRVDVAANP